MTRSNANTIPILTYWWALSSYSWISSQIYNSFLKTKQKKPIHNWDYGVANRDENDLLKSYFRHISLLWRIKNILLPGKNLGRLDMFGLLSLLSFEKDHCKRDCRGHIDSIPGRYFDSSWYQLINKWDKVIFLSKESTAQNWKKLTEYEQ